MCTYTRTQTHIHTTYLSTYVCVHECVWVYVPVCKQASKQGMLAISRTELVLALNSGRVTNPSYLCYKKPLPHAVPNAHECSVTPITRYSHAHPWTVSLRPALTPLTQLMKLLGYLFLSLLQTLQFDSQQPWNGDSTHLLRVPPLRPLR